jgi:hypothetical protein
VLRGIVLVQTLILFVMLPAGTQTLVSKTLVVLPILQTAARGILKLATGGSSLRLIAKPAIRNTLEFLDQ